LTTSQIGVTINNGTFIYRASPFSIQGRESRKKIQNR
jgi:hypothetical protein